MLVSRQESDVDAEVERGPRARTRRLMLDTASRLMQAGVTPSVSEVAEAAGVSRATAYRYFPSQAALVQAVVDEGLGPILDMAFEIGRRRRRRVADLLDTAMPRIDAFEATFKAALKLSLDQWAKRQAGTLGSEPQFTRGHRVELLKDALAPLRGHAVDARIRTPGAGAVAGLRRRGADRAKGYLGPRRRRNARRCTMGGALARRRRGGSRKGRIEGRQRRWRRCNLVRPVFVGASNKSCRFDSNSVPVGR